MTEKNLLEKVRQIHLPDLSNRHIHFRNIGLLFLPLLLIACASSLPAPTQAVIEPTPFVTNIPQTIPTASYLTETPINPSVSPLPLATEIPQKIFTDPLAKDVEITYVIGGNNKVSDEVIRQFPEIAEFIEDYLKKMRINLKNTPLNVKFISGGGADIAHTDIQETTNTCNGGTPFIQVNSKYLEQNFIREQEKQSIGSIPWKVNFAHELAHVVQLQELGKTDRRFILPYLDEAGADAAAYAYLQPQFDQYIPQYLAGKPIPKEAKNMIDYFNSRAIQLFKSDLKSNLPIYNYAFFDFYLYLTNEYGSSPLELLAKSAQIMAKWSCTWPPDSKSFMFGEDIVKALHELRPDKKSVDIYELEAQYLTTFFDQSQKYSPAHNLYKRYFNQTVDTINYSSEPTHLDGGEYNAYKVIRMYIAEGQQFTINFNQNELAVATIGIDGKPLTLGPNDSFPIYSNSNGKYIEYVLVKKVKRPIDYQLNKKR
ncbi:MAG: hypothetical protein Q7R95_10895 [bacterium]|nr:hypothetical protein [bacterium]